MHFLKKRLFSTKTLFSLSFLIISTTTIFTACSYYYEAPVGERSRRHDKAEEIRQEKATTYLKTATTYEVKHRHQVITTIRPNISDQEIEPKTILLWTPRFGVKSWERELERNGGDDVRLASGLSCRLTTNRSLVSQASGLVFHSWDINPRDKPTSRLPRQLWVFYMHEPPTRSGIVSRWGWDLSEKFHFNLTMSYVLNADVWFPYGQYYEYSKKTRLANAEVTSNKIDKFVTRFAKRQFEALWIVSDCESFSGREYFVRDLKEVGLVVKQWGNCSHNAPDEQWRLHGRHAFFTKYQFYLAFENSICDDYVSEKAFFALNASMHYGVIPVVFGGAKYSKFLPPGSFIDVNAFANAKQAVDFLKNLSAKQNKDLLRSYFAWQYKYYVDEDENAPFVAGWQALCDKLWEMDATGRLNQSKTVWKLRSQMGQCEC